MLAAEDQRHLAPEIQRLDRLRGAVGHRRPQIEALLVQRPGARRAVRMRVQVEPFLAAAGDRAVDGQLFHGADQVHVLHAEPLARAQDGADVVRIVDAVEHHAHAAETPPGHQPHPRRPALFFRHVRRQVLRDGRSTG